MFKALFRTWFAYYVLISLFFPYQELKANVSEDSSYTITLYIKQNSFKLPIENLRNDLYNELKIPIILGEPTVHSNALIVEVQDEHHILVQFKTSNKQSIQRVLDVSVQSQQATETIALLAGNLVRNEASELLAALQAKAQWVEKQKPKLNLSTQKKSQNSPRVLTKVPQEFFCVRSDQSLIPFHADVVPFVGTSSFLGTQSTRLISLNLLGGYGASIAGIEVGGIANIQSISMCGLQWAGLLNKVDGSMYGVQLAGMVNTAQRVNGLQISGISNTSNELNGAQISLITNMAYGPIRGAQTSLGYNLGTSIFGMQLGALNLNTGTLSGAQIGLVNIQIPAALGAQLGGINIATSSFQGAQLGALNISTKKLEGAQIGLLNIAEDSSASVGLLNVLWKGRTHIDVWTDLDRFTLSAAVKHGGRFLHNIYGIGVQNMGESKLLLNGIFGIGGQIQVQKKLFIDVDFLTYSSFLHLFSKTNFSILNQVRVVLKYQILNAFSFFIGPTFNVFVAQNKSLNDLTWLSNLRFESTSNIVRMWFGFTAGIQIF